MKYLSTQYLTLRPNETSMKFFRLIAILEGISYLLLFGVTMPLKYMFSMPLPNQIVGYIHGLLFIVYSILILVIWKKYQWGFVNSLLAFIASLLPFGTFVADARLFKKYQD